MFFVFLSEVNKKGDALEVCGSGFLFFFPPSVFVGRRHWCSSHFSPGMQENCISFTPFKLGVTLRCALAAKCEQT